jgi:hypothetical protein
VHQLVVAYADIVVLGVAVLSFLLLAFNATVRAAVGMIVRRSLQVWRCIASATAAVLDVVLPISARNAAVSRRALVLWLLLNLLPVAAWCAPPDVWSPARRWDAALAGAGFALFNLVFLTGAYCALKESVLFMNGDMPLRQRRFRDLSTATNMPLLVATAGVVLCQVAVLQHWLQAMHGVALIVMRDGRDMAYTDHLVAVLESLPVVSLLFSPTSFADQTEHVPGWGTFWARSIATFGSFLLVSIFLGFIQQRAALQHLLCRLLLQPEGTPMETLLRQRLLRAPPIVKRDLRLAFLTEDDDKRRLRLLDLALARHSFSAPAYFLRTYGSASPAVQAGGAAMAATFLARHAHQLDRDGAREVVSAALAAYTARALRGPAHLARAGNLVLPCLLRLVEIDGASSGEPHETTAFVRRKPIQDMLCAMLNEDDATPTGQSATRLLLRAKAIDCLPALLRSLQRAPDEKRIKVLTDMRALIDDRGIAFSSTKSQALLSEMVRTIDCRQHTWTPGAEASKALAALRAAVVDRQRGKPRTMLE